MFMETVRMWGWRLLQVVAVVAVVAAGASWYFAPVPVRSHRVGTGEIVAEVMGTGTLEARVKSTISPKIAGRVHEIFVDQGDQVQAGQLLFTLDDAELKQQVEIAQATIDAWNASLERLKADQEQAEAVLKLARQNFERIKHLVASKVVTTGELDSVTEQMQVGESGLSRAVAALFEGRKQVVTAEKTLAYNKARLADTRVTAPFDGLIVKRHRDPGDVGVPGSPVLTLASTEEIWVSAWVDETEMARLRVGQPARVVFRSEPARPYQGEVARLGREADRETREFVVDVRVATLAENWAVGQRAEVYVEVARHPDVTVLPATFVFWKENVPGVYCLTGNRATWRTVTLGARNAEIVEVTEGISVGDVVLMPDAGKNMSLENRRVVVTP
jgi:RND family efflux transporter MFP subunit